MLSRYAHLLYDWKKGLDSLLLVRYIHVLSPHLSKIGLSRYYPFLQVQHCTHLTVPVARVRR